jgi:hypothetical protein
MTDRLPLVAREPLQAPLAVQVVASVLDQLSVACCPGLMTLGVTWMLTVGGALTVRVADALVLPLGPVQSRV